jgi:hypothetical protein
LDVLEIETGVETARIINIMLNLFDTVDPMLGKHWEVLDEVLSIKPFSDWHFAYDFGFFHNILSSLEALFSVLPMLQEMTLQFGHGEFPLRELFSKTMSILLW